MSDSLPPHSQSPARRERLLLIGFTSLDQAVADRLMADGRMPRLAGLCAAGARGPLMPPEPLLPLAAWTTVATGRHPAIHRVMPPYVIRPDGGGAEMAGRAAWRAPAFWEVLEAAGRRTVTVGWPATAPASAWPGIHIDERFGAPTGPDFTTWAIPRGAVSPSSLLETLRQMRVHPTDVEGAMLAPFVPRLMEIDQSRDPGLARLALPLATVSTEHAVATALIEREDWDVAAVHYGWLSTIQSALPAMGPGTVWENVADIAYCFADALLGRLMDLAGEDTTIILVSPNGVRMPSGGGPVGWRPEGFLAARGRWIETGTTLPPARLVDLAPTLLARFGLVAETDGMTVRALAPGASRRPVTIPAMPAPPADRHVEALRALGYDDTPAPAAAAAMTLAESGRLLTLGEAMLALGYVVEAEAALTSARGLLPPDSPAGLRPLARCKVLRGNAAGCREVGETLMFNAPESGWGYLVMAAGHALRDDAAGAKPLIAAARERGAADPELMAQLGGVALLLKDADLATSCFSAALALEPGMRNVVDGMALARTLAERAG